MNTDGEPRQKNGGKKMEQAGADAARAQCSVFSVQCSVFSVQCSVISIQYSVFSVQSLIACPARFLLPRSSLRINVIHLTNSSGDGAGSEREEPESWT